MRYWRRSDGSHMYQMSPAQKSEDRCHDLDGFEEWLNVNDQSHAIF